MKVRAKRLMLYFFIVTLLLWVIISSFWIFELSRETKHLRTVIATIEGSQDLNRQACMNDLIECRMLQTQEMTETPVLSEE